jgi:hypothetical protein
MRTDDFRVAQLHVLWELCGSERKPLWRMDDLCERLRYFDPGLLRAAVERLRLVGLVYPGDDREVSAMPVARYLIEIDGINE